PTHHDRLVRILPDKRSHRGAGPEDHILFTPENQPILRHAVADLSWLMSRGYASPSAVKIVGDRYELTERQRSAVRRCACDDAALSARTSRRVAHGSLAGKTLLIDGYNVLT